MIWGDIPIRKESKWVFRGSSRRSTKKSQQAENYLFKLT
jgi:hypothetical protein